LCFRTISNNYRLTRKPILCKFDIKWGKEIGLEHEYWWSMNKKVKTGNGRPRSINILGSLLILQGIIMMFIGIWHFALSQGPKHLRLWLLSLFTQAPVAEEQYVSFLLFIQRVVAYASEHNLLAALVESAFLFILTVFAFVAAFGFFRLWPNAWTQAMFVQGASLALALIFYFIGKPPHIYIIMVCAIFMVLYLNYANVQDVFENRDHLGQRIKDGSG
jgi:hypothetical protein